jgi:hypothetical protein
MKYLIFELFSGVGFCNQLFSLEGAIYLSNITDRKLILLIKNPLCHCGRSEWKYGKIMELFTQDYLKYLPNGIEIYYKQIPDDINNLYKNAFKFSNKTFSNTIFIDKELNTEENKDDIHKFAHWREKIVINYDDFNNYEYLYVPNDISNASRCLYNFYTTKKNIILMNNICLSLTNYNTQIKNKLSLIKINFQYNAVHFRFGDYFVKEDVVNKNNDLIIQKFDELFKQRDTNMNTIPIFIMCDRKDNKILETLKEKYTIIFTDEYIATIPDCKFPDERPVENYLLEKYICENALTFIGSIGSTVSNYIQYNRYFNNKQSNINFQKTIINGNNYSWYDNNVGGHPISWSYFFNTNVFTSENIEMLEIKKNYLNGSSLLQDNSIFSYPPWNANCVLRWYNETDFTLTPIKTNTSTCWSTSCLKTENGGGIKLMIIGTHVNVLWDGQLHKEAYLEDENTIIIIHDNVNYKFIKV